MSAVWAWTLSGLAVAVIAPPLLAALVRRGVDARIILLTWATLLTATVVSIGLPALGEVVHRCWLVLHDGAPDSTDAVGGLLSATILLAAAVRALWALRCSRAARHALHDRHLGLARILDGVVPDHGVLWLPVAAPLAYSVAGHPPLVVASTGLRAMLDTDAVAGVLAHERAHLARGHHLLVAVAEAAAAGFWWLPLMRMSPALVRTLVEIDADVCAAQVHGRHVLARALKALPSAAVSVPGQALGIAGDRTGLRLARLTAQTSHRNAWKRAGSALAAAAAVLLTVASGVTVVGVTTLMSCANSQR